MTDCLFCKIALGELPTDIVYQDVDVLAFRDIDAQAPVHVLVIPRRHLAGFTDASDADTQLLGKLCLAAARVAALEGIEQSGYRCMINSGPDAQQSVHHLHLHVLGGRPMSGQAG